MPGDEAAAIQRSIAAIFSQTITNCDQAFVYRQQTSLIASTLTSWLPVLQSVRPSTTHLDLFRTLRRHSQTLQDLVGRFAEHEWFRTALDVPVQTPVRDINEAMRAMADILERLHGQSVSAYSPTRDQTAADYQAIYDLFANCFRGNARVQRRLNSLRKFMEHQNIAIPTPLQGVFSRVPEAEVKHSDFKMLDTIGNGATGTVRRAIQTATGRQVAIKQISSPELDDWEMACFTREIGALSRLKHPHVVEFMGATSTTPYWIVTAFVPGRSLFHRLRDPQGLSGFYKTTIAYQVADAMAFLHTQNVIHRDLKTLNVLLDENNDARLCDFGIAREADTDAVMTGSMGTFNYMAPEIIADKKYSLSADVFSFGMMLWECLTDQVPFMQFRNDHVKIAMALQRGERPKMPVKTPRDLRDLMKHCWDENPERRPTFSQILSLMSTKLISYPGTDVQAIKEFYKEKNSAPPLIDDRRLALELVRRPTSDLAPCLLRITNSAGMVASLRTAEFVTPAAPLLERPEYAEAVAKTLACVLDTPDLVNVFVSANGLTSLSAMLRGPDLVRAAVPLARRLVESLAPDKRQALAGDLVGAGAWDCALEFVESFRVNARAIVEPRMPEVLAAAEVSEKACQLLLKCVDIAALSDEQVCARLAIAARRAAVVDRLVQSDRFLMKLNGRSAEAVAAGLSGDASSRACAAKIAAVLPAEHLAGIAAAKGVLEQVLALADGDGRLIARLASVPAGAAAIIGQVGLFSDEIQNPQIFAVFVDLAKEFGEKLLQVEWFVNALARNFMELENIEATLRLVCHLAETDLLVECGLIIKRLTRLLRSGECSVAEMHVLLAIYEQLSPHCSFVDIYGYLLQAAEARVGYCGTALRVLARQKMPVPKTKYSVRLLAAVAACLVAGDEEATKAAGELLMAMAKKAPYAKEIAQSQLKDAVLQSLLSTQSGDVFEILLTVLKLCGISASPEVIRAGQQIVGRLEGGGGQPDNRIGISLPQGSKSCASGIIDLLDEMK
jgi:serine/threonine protein kinase